MCDCPEARAYRAYWTDEAVGVRLADELKPYQDAYQASLVAAINDVRGWRRIYDAPGEWGRQDYAHAMAAQVAPWSARV